MGKKRFMPAAYEPKRCWVGETNKVCYASEEEAELMAQALEYQHGVKLKAYKCSYGEHWHLAKDDQKR